jgi:hypothetical protein
MSHIINYHKMQRIVNYTKQIYILESLIRNVSIKFKSS